MSFVIQNIYEGKWDDLYKNDSQDEAEKVFNRYKELHPDLKFRIVERAVYERFVKGYEDPVEEWQ